MCDHSTVNANMNMVQRLGHCNHRRHRCVACRLLEIREGSRHISKQPKSERTHPPLNTSHMPPDKADYGGLGHVCHMPRFNMVFTQYFKMTVGDRRADEDVN